MPRQVPWPSPVFEGSQPRALRAQRLLVIKLRVVCVNASFSCRDCVKSLIALRLLLAEPLVELLFKLASCGTAHIVKSNNQPPFSGSSHHAAGLQKACVLVAQRCRGPRCQGKWRRRQCTLHQHPRHAMSLDYTRRESQAWVKLSREGYYNVKSGSYGRADGQATQEGAPEPSSAQALYEASRAKRLAKHKQLASGASALVLPQHASHRFYAEGGEEGHSVFLDFPQRSDARSGGAQGASPASSSSEGEGKAVARVPFSQGDADARNANVLRQYASQVEERIASL